MTSGVTSPTRMVTSVCNVHFSSSAPTFEWSISVSGEKRLLYSSRLWSGQSPVPWAGKGAARHATAAARQSTAAAALCEAVIVAPSV